MSNVGLIMIILDWRVNLVGFKIRGSEKNGSSYFWTAAVVITSEARVIEFAAKTLKTFHEGSSSMLHLKLKQ